MAECFMLTVNESPKSPSTCRVAIVTNDGLLADMMEERIKSRDNVRVLRNLDDLQSLINTLVSNVTEQFVAGVREAARVYFFTEATKEGLYYKENIRERVREQFKEKLSELPSGAIIRENGTWHIGSPSFVEKKQQRIFWRTSIRIEANSFKLGSPKSSSFNWVPSTPTLSAPSPSGLGLTRPSTPTGPAGLTLLEMLEGTGVAQTFLGGESPERILVSKGHSLFHVTWSVVISSKKKLSHPKIENIEWKETLWE